MIRGILPPNINGTNINDFMKFVREKIYRDSGAGSAYYTYQTIMTQIDRHKVNLTIPNLETTGYTFITRPKLNLSTPSVRMDPVLETLDTEGIETSMSLAHALRCLLDTKYARSRESNSSANAFFNVESPFLIPAMNMLQSSSGWPDFILDTETTNVGYHGEDQTFPTGSDFLNKSYDLTLSFREIGGGVIMALFLYWVYWIALVKKNIVSAYPEDIAAKRYCYTCSIYRFIMDPSRRTITKFAKATGCFPVAVPIGASFNFSEDEHTLSSNSSITINFKANHIEYMNPEIFMDFNTVVQRYGPRGFRSNYVPLDQSATYNYLGIPYVENMNQLVFYAPPSSIDDGYRQKIERYGQGAREQLAPTYPTQDTPILV